MRIKLYIVTYRNPLDLETNLNSIFSSDLCGTNLTIHILNNHTEFTLKDELLNKVEVLHNTCRPDFSTGHLSRSWNQCILHGFKDLNNPDCDILITCQDDTVFQKDWLSRLLQYHKTYSFITAGVGDNFCSYLPEAVKNIGLWDERFCSIGYQEADYFLRARIYNKNSSINDLGHGRMYQNVFKNFKEHFCRRTDRIPVSEYHINSMNFHDINRHLLTEKWGSVALDWKNGKFPTKCGIDNYITYPYFEKNVLGLREKGYFINGFNYAYDTKIIKPNISQNKSQKLEQFKLEKHNNIQELKIKPKSQIEFNRIENKKYKKKIVKTKQELYEELLNKIK